MTPTLFFLRSSEQKIATDMLYYGLRLDEAGTTLDAHPELRVFERGYGLTSRDLGLYALSDHQLAGAAWIRLLRADDNAPGFVDERTPVLVVGVKPEFRGEGIGSAMLEQLLLEAGALYDRVSVSVASASQEMRFFERFGFTGVPGSEGRSPVDGSDTFTLIKELERVEIRRPTEGYDPTYWMD
jgi:ribosomal protein S18 acetylase RimI-like enzyme